MKELNVYLDDVIIEGKATVFYLNKLKYFSKNTILRLLNSSSEFHNKRLAFEDGKLGGTQKDVKLFIKKLIDNDIKATKELNSKITKDQEADYKYLKSI